MNDDLLGVPVRVESSLPDRDTFSRNQKIAYWESWDAYMDEHDLVHLLIYIPMAMWQQCLDCTNGNRQTVVRSMAADIVAAHIARYGEIDAAEPPPLPPWKINLATQTDAGTWSWPPETLPARWFAHVAIPAIIWDTQLGLHFSDMNRAQEAVAQMAIDAHIDRFGSLSGWQELGDGNEQA